MEYKINKEKCTGCMACFRRCQKAIKMGEDGKAEIISQNKLEECGGESLCPFGAIERLGGGDYPPRNINVTQVRGGGRGMGKGMGRGLGVGPRDGRGKGRGGGGRRR